MKSTYNEKIKSFEIYATKDNAVAIDDPVRLKIMHILRNSECPFQDLVDELNLTKGTVSVYLKELGDKGLIAYREDPEDRRRKIFFATSQYIGTSDKPLPELSMSIKKVFCESIGDPVQFIRLIFNAVRYGLESLGINTQPVLRIIGRQIGEEIADTMTSNNLNDLLNEIAQFWSAHRLGTMSKIEEQLIKIEDCFDCGLMPNVGRSLCALDEGMLEAILDIRLNKVSTVREIKCCGLGDPYCTFSITFTEKNENE